ncbi:DMT family transporter [Xinfangfangia sp. CPCC 101601]|uniref:DMT family transporter n=1 Tax=Pseudogemmobacter lacusdianii TaxID=3069608 RepID=A0ABU0VZ36_9RHOB|nr:DMT family transporter [Xinfangfangia sp. CPCC 101601]MDQ2067009.1 DMT family transporter [Xinfangfangia sp. CPCC 101601]
MSSSAASSLVTPTLKPLLGIGLMTAAMMVLPGIDVLAKFLGAAGLPILVVVWARALFGTILVVPLVVRSAGLAGLRPQNLRYHIARAFLLYSSTWLFFSALKYLPIADAMAIFFINPLIVTLLAALVLRERVGPKRWAAVAVGFIGTLIIIRPGMVEMNQGTLLALAAGVSVGSYFVMTHARAGRDDANVLTFHTSLIGTLAMTAMLPMAWQMPDATQWLMLIALGLIATTGHLLITFAYKQAEASLLAPLAFVEIIMAVFFGWWFFAELPDRWTILGVAILISSAIYISLRTRKVAKAQAQG